MWQRTVPILEGVNFVHRITVNERSVITRISLCALIAWAVILPLVRTVQPSEKDMRLLQNNIQSITTSIPLLRHAVKRLDIDVITLQEIWHPENGSINIRDYTHQFVKLRSGKRGGVAILTRKNVKVVYLKEYEVDNLEAIWVDVEVNNVRTVIGSVYIPPGDAAALDILDKVIDRILQSHNHLVIGMDANSRSVLWDDSCIGISEYQKSRKMGIKLEEIIDKHSMYVHNTGVPTFRSGNLVSAPDVTLSKGISQYGQCCLVCC